MTETPKDRDALVEMMADAIFAAGYNPATTLDIATVARDAIEGAGLSIVPIEPTAEMLKPFGQSNRGTAPGTWRSAVAASPYAPVTP